MLNVFDFISPFIARQRERELISKYSKHKFHRRLLPEFLRFLSIETGVPSPVGVVGAEPSLSVISGTGSVSGLSSVSIESVRTQNSQKLVRWLHFIAWCVHFPLPFVLLCVCDLCVYVCACICARMHACVCACTCMYVCAC